MKFCLICYNRYSTYDYEIEESKIDEDDTVDEETDELEVSNIEVRFLTMVIVTTRPKNINI